MIQSNDSGSPKTPGFGAFIGSTSNDNSTGATRESSTSTTKEGSKGRSSKKRGSSRSGGSRGRAKKSEADAPRTEPDPPAEEGSVAGTRSRGRGSRGGRRRRGRRAESEQGAEAADSGTEAAPAAEGGVEEPAEGRPRRKRSSRGGRGRGRKAADGEAPAAEASEPESTDEGGDEKPTRRRSRGGAKKTAAKKTAAKKTGRKKSPRRASAADDADDAAPESSAEGEDKPKRRRRGTRGGRGRTKKVSGRREAPAAAVVEFIPGEEDDLPELPELPDEAELINQGELEGEEEASSGRGRKKKRSRRKKAGAESGAEKTTAKRAAAVKPDRQILVNACDSQEMRVAVVKDGKILDFQMNVDSDTSLVNDIYRGRIVNIEASIGAAFVDFGRGRNGFLHTSDVLPTYAERGIKLSQLLTTSIDPEDWDASSSQPGVSFELVDDDSDADEAEGGDDADEADDGNSGKKRSAKKTTKKKAAKKAARKRGGRDAGKGGRGKGRQRTFRARPRRPIGELFKVGQKVVVQITKDAIGDKGPTLTTYLSIPGRYLVLMPSISHRGVSRKIEDSKERKRLKRILDGMSVPDGMGIIARTATEGRTKAEIKRDLDYLLSAWNRLSKRLDRGHGPTALYQESDVAIRTVRDLFGPETESVIIDDNETYKNIREFAEQLMPEHVDRIVEHDGARPLFHAQGVEQDFEKIFARRLELPSGGSVIFDQAEALVAIDINSGKTRTSSHDFEEIALKTNMEAVPEIARQIRLRDLGGIIVVDFIDMMKAANRRAVEQAFRACFAEDRARSKVGRISQFGLLEMTRQRLGPGMSKKLFRPCTACRGAGRQRTDSSRAAAILRRLGSALTLKGFSKVEVKAHPETVEYLQKHRKRELGSLEESSGRKLELKKVAEQVEDSVLRYLRADGREVRPGGRRKR